MKVLEVKNPTVEITCPHCGSRLLLEKGDIHFSKDITGTSVPYVTCGNRDCNKSIDVEGVSGIHKLY